MKLLGATTIMRIVIPVGNVFILEPARPGEGENVLTPLESGGGVEASVRPFIEINTPMIARTRRVTLTPTTTRSLLLLLRLIITSTGSSL